MKSDTATRFIGLCPVCEGNFKLANGKLVHHGYERPGDGMIHGDCFTVGMEPHETSPKAAEEFRTLCRAKLVGAKSYLARLQAGEIKSIIKSSPWSKTATIYTAESMTVKNLVTGEEKVTTGIVAEYEFKQTLESSIRETEFEIRGIEGHIARMDGHLKDWAPKPLLTFDESVSALKAAKEAAKGVRTTARKARIDAKVASYQKRIDSAYSRFQKGVLVAKSTLADIFESSTHAWHSLGFKSHSELLAVIDRNAIWTGFGLLLDAPYRSDAYKANDETLRGMRSARYA